MNESVRDHCRAAGEALRAHRGAAAQTAAEAAVRLAFHEGDTTLEARAQALLTRALVAVTLGTGDQGAADGQRILDLLAPPVEDHPEVILPEVLIHLLAGVARWADLTGRTDHAVLATSLLERIKALVGQHWGPDHPRYLLLLASWGETGRKTLDSGSMGLWHL